MTPPTDRENANSGRGKSADTRPKPDGDDPSRKWPRPNLLGLGLAAVAAVYAAGFLKTRDAAARFADDAVRRPPNTDPADAHDAAAIPAQLAAARTDSTPRPDTPATRAIAAAPKPKAQPHLIATAAPTPASSATAAPTTPAVPTPAPAPPATDSTPTTSPASEVPPPPSPLPPDSTKPAFRDGTFSGWGSSRHGDIQVTVEVQHGRITNAWISACLTRWSCSWVAHLQGQVVARQSADVDYVSGATQSGNAFYYAAVEAVARAKGTGDTRDH